MPRPYERMSTAPQVKTPLSSAELGGHPRRSRAHCAKDPCTPFSLPLAGLPHRRENSSSNAKTCKDRLLKIRGATERTLLPFERRSRRGIVTPSSGTMAAPSLRRRWPASPPISLSQERPKVKVQAIEAYAAKSHSASRPYSRTSRHARAAETGAHLLHPYDDDRISPARPPPQGIARGSWRSGRRVCAGQRWWPVEGGDMLGAKGIRRRSNLPAANRARR